MQKSRILACSTDQGYSAFKLRIAHELPSAMQFVPFDDFLKTFRTMLQTDGFRLLGVTPQGELQGLKHFLDTMEAAGDITIASLDSNELMKLVSPRLRYFPVWECEDELGRKKTMYGLPAMEALMTHCEDSIEQHTHINPDLVTMLHRYKVLMEPDIQAKIEVLGAKITMVAMGTGEGAVEILGKDMAQVRRRRQVAPSRARAIPAQKPAAASSSAGPSGPVPLPYYPAPGGHSFA